MLNVKEMSKKAKAIALGVGVAALLTAAGMLAFSGPAPKVLVEGDYIEAQAGLGDSLGSSENTRTNANSNFDETCVVDPTQTKLLCRGVAYGTMPAVGVATTTDYWKNSIGRSVYVDVDGAFIQFAGTASSSVSVSMGTSTVSGIAAYTSTGPANLIAATTVATSTIGGQQKSVVVTAGAVHSAIVADGEYVLISWKQENNNCSGAFCEAVTSTARGYTATYYIPYFYTKGY